VGLSPSLAIYLSIYMYIYLCLSLSACVCVYVGVYVLILCVNVIITGNELIHQLTNDGPTYTLRVDLTNYTGHSIFAKYDNFSVGPESDNYMLHVSGYDTGSSAGNCHSHT